jgi:hypothetical protein
MKPFLLALTVVGFALSTLVSGQGGNPQFGKPKRLNKMIELLEAAQPVYESNVTGAGYEEDKKLAQTTNDLIQYEMEHGRSSRSACATSYRAVPVNTWKNKGLLVGGEGVRLLTFSPLATMRPRKASIQCK